MSQVPTNTQFSLTLDRFGCNIFLLGTGEGRPQSAAASITVMHISPAAMLNMTVPPIDHECFLTGWLLLPG